MNEELKQKCKCGHSKEVHAPLSLQGIYNNNKDEYDGECCIIYVKDRNQKCCPCMKFEKATKDNITKWEREVRKNEDRNK